MTEYYYQDEFVTIYHGDCRELLADLGTDAALVTDPPYGIGFASQPTKWQRRAGQKPETWDDVRAEVANLLTFDVAVIWGGNYFGLPPSRGWLAWVKPDAPPSMASVEFAWTSLDRNSRYIVHSIGATNAERVGHPTQKPLAVMRWTLAQLPPLRVVDPYCGSGTTLVAAKEFGRRAVGIEIEERYCEMAAKRCSQEVLGLSA